MEKNSTGICTDNICKGKILKDHINNVELKHLIFIGDGKNDYCGGLQLNNDHHFFVRKNLSLQKFLSTNLNLTKMIRSKIIYWDSAQDIIDNLSNVIFLD